MYKQLALLILALCFGLSASAPAATIVWVSFHAADDQPVAAAANVGFTEASDIGYTDLLKAQGYNVVRYVSTTTPDAAVLNAADLVIISRAASSSNYQDAAATTWNTTITAPMMLLGGYALRQSRLGFYTGDTIPDTTGDIRLTVTDPAHPIFAGIPLSNGTMDNLYAGVVPIPTDGTMSRGISIVSDPANANGTVLATVAAGSPGPAGAMVIAEWPAGATLTHAGGAGTDVLAGPRLVFLTGSREPDGVTGGEAAGIFDLHPDGTQMFINAVRYLLGETGEPAIDPNPEDQAVDVPVDAGLSWTAGKFAATHDVYFGTSRADVNDAGRADPKGVLVSQDQADTTYQPTDLLEYGQVYYWRVDEVNAAPDYTVFKGTIWSFTAEPVSYPIENVTATASSANGGMGPEKAVDGSGLNADDQHSTEATDMWLSASGGEQPTWIQFEFDQVYKLDQLLVWNSNQLIESILGFGVKDVTVSYSADGEVWTRLGDFQFAQAPGAPTCTPEAAVDFGGAAAKFVKLAINSNWGGMVAQYGLSEVRFLYIPAQPREPMPANDAADVEPDTQLSWRAGRGAASHQVFFSTDADAVADGTAPVETVTDSSFNPGDLALGTTYYWKVAEINEAATPSVWDGNVWSFSTREYLDVDNMETYNDDDNRIYEAWEDGLTTGASGSTVGYMEAPFAETTIVHGGKQSMPLAYDNTSFPVSEAVRSFSPAANWTTYGVKSLVLYFRGAPENTGTLYLKINNTKVAYPGDPTHISSQAWWPWVVDLSTISGANKVTTLTIGVEGAGAKGIVYLDDIGLYRDAPKPIDIEILWVSFHAADDTPSSGAAGAGLTEASDKAYTDLLKANGYDVVRYVQTGTPDLDIVNAARLVIISRSVASGSFQDAAATTWNTAVAPMINLNGYTIRNNRLGFSSGDTIVDTTGDIKLAVNDASHPIFAGISLTNGVMKNPYAGVAAYPNGTAARGLSIVTTPATQSGTVLATVSTDSSAAGPAGALVIAEWPAGATVTHAGGAGTDVLGGPRLVFLTGAREADGVNSETAGLYDLSGDGETMFLNAVKYMLEKQ